MNNISKIDLSNVEAGESIKITKDNLISKQSCKNVVNTKTLKNYINSFFTMNKNIKPQLPKDYIEGLLFNGKSLSKGFCRDNKDMVDIKRFGHCKINTNNLKPNTSYSLFAKINGYEILEIPLKPKSLHRRVWSGRTDSDCNFPDMVCLAKSCGEIEVVYKDQIHAEKTIVSEYKDNRKF
jgi:hypothetical protein